MSSMNVRATYALDQQTADEIRHLARLWGVSQAEVVRRAVHRAAESELEGARTPAEVIAHYARGAVSRDWPATAALVASMRALRHEGEAHRDGDD